MDEESTMRQKAECFTEKANQVPQTFHEENIGLERYKTVLWP